MVVEDLVTSYSVNWVCGCVCGWLGDNAVFLHAVAQKLQNTRSFGIGNANEV